MRGSFGRKVLQEIPLSGGLIDETILLQTKKEQTPIN